MKNITLPKEIIEIGEVLHKAGFEAYAIGGCVRDFFLGNTPKDWDVTTNALPEEVEKLFPHSHYDNVYGTVRVVNDDVEEGPLKVVEITTYRLESGYSDNRRPDEVRFSTKLEDDLKRRDFTVNALALPIQNVSRETSVTRESVIDLFEGFKDLDHKIVRAVGDSDERFQEDGLRLIRGVRFAAQLGFMINTDTLASIEKNNELLKSIAVERIQDEFNKLIMSENPSLGLELLQRTGLLKHFIPELEEALGVEQNQAHSYTVWEHLLRSLQATADKGWRLELRLTALFHDISKPATQEWSKERNDWSFHGHEVVGSRETRKILKRMKYSSSIIEEVSKLVRWHMFFSDPDQITLSAVRRIIRNVGPELIWDLMNIRVADRIGTGTPKEKPYRLRKYHSMIEEALRDPISVGMLKIDGNDLRETFHVEPGPKMGYVLHALLEEVLDDPKKNTEGYLQARTKELLALEEAKLQKLGTAGKEARQEAEQKEVEKLRSKHHVK